jgi:LPPG:FO 2-phospho-L-lactate transferase
VDGDASGWFNLGDRDLGTHLYRTSRLAAGLSLSEVTAEITKAWAIGARLIPATDSEIRTRVNTTDGRMLAFQEYFVKERHEVEVSSVVVEGAQDATPAPGVIEAIENASAILIAPSNPIVSINPILAVPGIREAVMARRDDVAAISPIVGGHALKGPADRLMRELGHDPSVVGVAEIYREVSSCLVIDLEDQALVDDVKATGMNCVVTDTIMRSPSVSAELARVSLEAAGNSEWD